MVDYVEPDAQQWRRALIELRQCDECEDAATWERPLRAIDARYCDAHAAQHDPESTKQLRQLPAANAVRAMLLLAGGKLRLVPS